MYDCELDTLICHIINLLKNTFKSIANLFYVQFTFRIITTSIIETYDKMYLLLYLIHKMYYFIKYIFNYLITNTNTIIDFLLKKHTYAFY